MLTVYLLLLFFSPTMGFIKLDPDINLNPLDIGKDVVNDVIGELGELLKSPVQEVENAVKNVETVVNDVSSIKTKIDQNVETVKKVWDDAKTELDKVSDFLDQAKEFVNEIVEKIQSINIDNPLAALDDQDVVDTAAALKQCVENLSPLEGLLPQFDSESLNNVAEEVSEFVFKLLALLIAKTPPFTIAINTLCVDAMPTILKAIDSITDGNARRRLFAQTPPSAVAVFNESETVNLRRNFLLTAVDIYDAMHFEMDITVHSLQASGWRNIFRCGSTSKLKMPHIAIHSNADDDGTTAGRFHIKYSTEKTWDDGPNLVGDALVAGETYHLEIDWTQSWITMRIDGETVYDAAKSKHANYENLPCYASDPWDEAADASVSNLVISGPRSFGRRRLPETEEQCTSTENTLCGKAPIDWPFDQKVGDREKYPTYNDKIKSKEFSGELFRSSINLNELITGHEVAFHWKLSKNILDNVGDLVDVWSNVELFVLSGYTWLVTYFVSILHAVNAGVSVASEVMRTEVQFAHVHEDAISSAMLEAALKNSKRAIHNQIVLGRRIEDSVRCKFVDANGVGTAPREFNAISFEFLTLIIGSVLVCVIFGLIIGFKAAEWVYGDVKRASYDAVKYGAETEEEVTEFKA